MTGTLYSWSYVIFDKNSLIEIIKIPFVYLFRPPPPVLMFLHLSSPGSLNDPSHTPFTPTLTCHHSPVSSPRHSHTTPSPSFPSPEHLDQASQMLAEYKAAALCRCPVITSAARTASRTRATHIRHPESCATRHDEWYHVCRVIDMCWSSTLYTGHNTSTATTPCRSYSIDTGHYTLCDISGIPGRPSLCDISWIPGRPSLCGISWIPSIPDF